MLGSFNFNEGIHYFYLGNISRVDYVALLI